MLHPNNNRLDYGKVLEPPENFKLDFAIGTTYSLDLDSLIGACIALGLSEQTDSELMNNPVYLLEALRSTGDKVALFCEGGQIHNPKNITILYILLEQMVFQVNTVKRRGYAKYPSFHPKFWLIRYIDKKNNVLYRLVVLSRNLTFDRSWDVTFVIEGKIHEHKTLKTSPVADFLTYLTKHLTNDQNAKAKLKTIRAIIRELSYVHFELNSKEFDDFEFLPIGMKDSMGEYHSIKNELFDPLFKNSFHEILVMSPFLTNTIIKDFNDRNTNIEKANYMLFTRTFSLAKLNPNDCRNFRIFTMRDEVVYGESLISDEDSQLQNQDIHAKLFMVRKYSDSYLYLGSLNATNNAIMGNIEFMLMLKTKNRYLNITKLSEELFNGLIDNPSNPFQEVNNINDVLIEEDQEKQNDLDKYIKKLNHMRPSAIVVENGDYYDLSITFNKYEQCKYSITISPMLSNKTEAIAKNLLFTMLSLTQLSGFYKISISDEERTVQRVIIIPTEGLPNDREKAVVSSIINNKENFFRYIAFLLGDNFVSNALEVASSSSFADSKTMRKSVQIPALYEKMLQTAATAPEKLKGIEYLINTITYDNVIPKHFVELYDMFKKVVKQNG